MPFECSANTDRLFARSLCDGACAPQPNASRALAKFKALPKSLRPQIPGSRRKLDDPSLRFARKRPSLHESEGGNSKRFCGAHRERGIAAGKLTGIQFGTNEALEDLRGVLQCMGAEWRQSSIANLPVRIRKALLAFMEKTNVRQTLGNGNRCTTKSRNRSSSCFFRPRIRQLRLHPIKSTYGRSYFAQVDTGLLRIYTRGQRDVAKAKEHQLLLSQVRDALHTAGSKYGVWKNPDEIEKDVNEVLSRNESSQEELGLHACVQMRATGYVHRRYVITSPVMPLIKAMHLRTSLISARRTSWESFREQWVRLMLSTRRAAAGTSLEKMRRLMPTRPGRDSCCSDMNWPCKVWSGPWNAGRSSSQRHVSRKADSPKPF